MGGDQGSRLCVSAVAKFAAVHPSVNFFLVGAEDEIRKVLPDPPSNIQLLNTDVFVSMTDKPGQALRHKSQSSMALAIELVAAGTAQACVSSGNTGALMAFGLQKLGTLPGIDRPAICKAIPASSGRSFMLDLGANIECGANHLLQFAFLGSAMATAAGVDRPKIGLLNVGIEAHKGGQLQQQALKLLHASELNTLGFVEGDGIYSGIVDVVVCDGFTGNAVLKACEGAAALMRSSLREKLAGADLSFDVNARLQTWVQMYNPEKYNGAALLGLNGVVVKSHGDTTEAGFIAALQVAKDQVEAGYLAVVSGLLKHL